MTLRPGFPRSAGIFLAIWVGTLAVAVNAGAQDLTELPPEFAAAAEVQLPDDPATVIAVVSRSRILLGDLLPKVEAQVRSRLAAAPGPIPEKQVHILRVMLLRGLLRQTISNKMMRESFLLDQVATETDEKRREASEMMETRARQMFVESKLPDLKEQLGTEDLGEIDAKLREQGTSLYALQRDFIDQMLGHLYRRSKIDTEPDVSIAEIYEYYQAHPEKYRHGARARWEQLTVLFDNFLDREAARAEIWKMLQEARFGGSMQAVARAKSQEPFASSGGVHDWTNQGSLASEALDRAIFDPQLPLNQISDVIEDEQGYHVVRVLEREPEGRTPLSQVQDEIRETIRRQKIEQAELEVLEEMKARVPVWSMFPDDIPGAMPLPGMAANGPARRFR